jgi:hypothetical protein
MGSVLCLRPGNHPQPPLKFQDLSQPLLTMNLQKLVTTHLISLLPVDICSQGRKMRARKAPDPSNVVSLIVRLHEIHVVNESFIWSLISLAPVNKDLGFDATRDYFPTHKFGRSRLTTTLGTRNGLHRIQIAFPNSLTFFHRKNWQKMRK